MLELRFTRILLPSFPPTVVFPLFCFFSASFPRVVTRETPTLPFSSRVSTHDGFHPLAREIGSTFRFSLFLSFFLFGISNNLSRGNNSAAQEIIRPPCVCTENRTRVFPLLHNQSFPRPWRTLIQVISVTRPFSLSSLISLRAEDARYFMIP